MCSGIVQKQLPFCSATVVSGTPQTDNTSVIVGGAIAGILLLTIAMTVIVVVALLRNRISQTARTTEQYVDDCGNVG